MIEISPAAACTLYLGLTLFFVLSLWGYQHYRGRKKKLISVAQELFICEYCHFAYLDELQKKVTQCPQCRSYNSS